MRKREAGEEYEFIYIYLKKKLLEIGNMLTQKSNKHHHHQQASKRTIEANNSNNSYN